MANARDDNSGIRSSKGFRYKLVLLLVLLTVIVIGYLLLSDALTLEALANQEGRLRDFHHEQPLFSYAIAFSIYVGVTGLSLPGATVLTLAYGWLFGLIRGVILVSFASTAGATLAFLLSRYLLREAIEQKFGKRLIRFDEALRKEGAFYLFTLRLIPVVPFFVINALMGLTPIRALTYWWVSQLGMLPGTIVYVYAGSSVPSLQALADEGIEAVLSPQQLTKLLIAFALLGLFPLAVRWTFRYFGISTPNPDNNFKTTEATKS